MDASRKELLDIQATIECGFTQKYVRDMTKTYSITLTFVNQVIRSHNIEGNTTILLKVGTDAGAQLEIFLEQGRICGVTAL